MSWLTNQTTQFLERFIRETPLKYVCSFHPCLTGQKTWIRNIALEQCSKKFCQEDLVPQWSLETISIRTLERETADIGTTLENPKSIKSGELHCSLSSPWFSKIKYFILLVWILLNIELHCCKKRAASVTPQMLGSLYQKAFVMEDIIRVLTLIKLVLDILNSILDLIKRWFRWVLAASHHLIMFYNISKSKRPLQAIRIKLF